MAVSFRTRASMRRGRLASGRSAAARRWRRYATRSSSSVDVAGSGITPRSRSFRTARALHAAGARTAITSLWRVDDASTRRLFEVFYTKLWDEGLGKADALWAAKSALRMEGHPPRDWAGWVLTGDPD